MTIKEARNNMKCKNKVIVFLLSMAVALLCFSLCFLTPTNVKADSSSAFTAKSANTSISQGMKGVELSGKNDEGYYFDAVYNNSVALNNLNMSARVVSDSTRNGGAHSRLYMYFMPTDTSNVTDTGVVKLGLFTTGKTGDAEFFLDISNSMQAIRLSSDFSFAFRLFYENNSWYLDFNGFRFGFNGEDSSKLTAMQNSAFLRFSAQYQENGEAPGNCIFQIKSINNTPLGEKVALADEDLKTSTTLSVNNASATVLEDGGVTMSTKMNFGTDVNTTALRYTFDGDYKLSKGAVDGFSVIIDLTNVNLSVIRCIDVSFVPYTTDSTKYSVWDYGTGDDSNALAFRLQLDNGVVHALWHSANANMTVGQAQQKIEGVGNRYEWPAFIKDSYISLYIAKIGGQWSLLCNGVNIGFGDNQTTIAGVLDAINNESALATIEYAGIGNGEDSTMVETFTLQAINGYVPYKSSVISPDNPDTPDTPDNPDNPDTPDTPDNPDNPDTPDNPNPPAYTGETLEYVTDQWRTFGHGGSDGSANYKYTNFTIDEYGLGHSSDVRPATTDCFAGITYMESFKTLDTMKFSVRIDSTFCENSGNNYNFDANEGAVVGMHNIYISNIPGKSFHNSNYAVLIRLFYPSNVVSNGGYGIVVIWDTTKPDFEGETSVTRICQEPFQFPANSGEDKNMVDFEFIKGQRSYDLTINGLSMSDYIDSHTNPHHVGYTGSQFGEDLYAILEIMGNKRYLSSIICHCGTTSGSYNITQHIYSINGKKIVNNIPDVYYDANYNTLGKPLSKAIFDNAVTFKWKKPAFAPEINEYEYICTGYVLKVYEGKNTSGTLVNTVTIPSIDTLEYQYIGLNPDTDYTFELFATKVVGTQTFEVVQYRSRTIKTTNTGNVVPLPDSDGPDNSGGGDVNDNNSSSNDVVETGCSGCNASMFLHPGSIVMYLICIASVLTLFFFNRKKTM